MQLAQQAQEYRLCRVDMNRHSCLPSAISVLTETHLMGRDAAKDIYYLFIFYFFAQRCTSAFFIIIFYPLPGARVTHPQPCRARSCPGSVMSSGFSVRSTVRPVCVGGGGGFVKTLPFLCVRRLKKKKTPKIYEHIWLKQSGFEKQALVYCILWMGFSRLVLVIWFDKPVKGHLCHPFPCLSASVCSKTFKLSWARSDGSLGTSAGCQESGNLHSGVFFDIAMG